MLLLPIDDYYCSKKIVNKGSLILCQKKAVYKDQQNFSLA